MTIRRKSLIAATLLLGYAGLAFGAITAEEAKKLGTTLTPIGAEKAGNKDGTIPEYSGGLTTAPAGFKKGSPLRPDPFAAEKPAFVIDQKNVAKYADKLTDGQKTLMKKYPGFRMDVYKTHRTAAFPKFVNDNTVKQATTTRTANNGLTLVGAHAAYPFPIPKDGFEAMWNHIIRFNGISLQHNPRSWVVNASGRPTMTYQLDELLDWPYWDPKRDKSDLFWRLKDIATGPPRNVGEMLLVLDPLDMYGKGRRAWQYLPGQRRTKLAPDINYDTPNTQLKRCLAAGRLGLEEFLDLIQRRRKFIALVAEHDLPRLVLAQHVAAMHEDFPDGLLALHQADAIAPPQTPHAALLRPLGIAPGCCHVSTPTRSCRAACLSRRRPRARRPSPR